MGEDVKCCDMLSWAEDGKISINFYLRIGTSQKQCIMGKECLTMLKILLSSCCFKTQARLS